MATIRVFKYGLLPPSSRSEPRVREQLRAAHAYQNKLIEIERASRAERRKLMLEHAPDFAEATAALTKASAAEAALRERVHGKRKRAVPPELRQELEAAVQARKDARQRVVAAEAQLRNNPAYNAAREAAMARVSVAQKAARASCGVYWGTYLLVEGAVEQASKTLGPDGKLWPLPLWSFFDGVKELDPRFASFDGQGLLGAQIQKGAVVQEDGSIEPNPLVRLEPRALPPNADPKSRRSALRPRMTLWLRVGSAGPGGREPIWATWPLNMHRPLPAGARVKYVTVQLQRVGPLSANGGEYSGERWTAQITVELPETLTPTRPVPASGRVGVDLGWRVVEGGLRVGFLAGSDGALEEIRVPPTTLERLAKADELRGVRDRDFNVIKVAVAGWLGGGMSHELDAAFLAAVAPHRDHWFKNQAFHTPLPASARSLENLRLVRERGSHVALWRSPQRLHDLEAFWATHRFPGDDVVLAVLHAWSEQDRHLWAWEANVRRKALAHRRDVYRVIARRLADTYAELVIGDVNIARVVEASSGTQPAAGHFQAAPGELRAALVNAFAGRVIYAPVGVTKADLTPLEPSNTCWSCGHREAWDRTELCHTCSACGLRWDQDENAARIYLAYQGPSTRQARTVSNSWAEAKAAKKARTEGEPEAAS